MWARFPYLPPWERCLIHTLAGEHCQKAQGHTDDHEWRHPSGFVRVTWPRGFGRIGPPAFQEHRYE